MRSARFLVAAGAGCLALAGSPSALAAPPNDAFADARVLSGGTGAVTGSNSGATKEAGEPDHAGSPGGASTWFVWTAPADAQLHLDTFGSRFDTVLAVYTGADVAALTEVASNDDSAGMRASALSFAAVQGTSYYIAVDSFDERKTGAFSLAWGPAPANDNFADRLALAGASGSKSGTLQGATDEAGEPLHGGGFEGGGASVWYEWTAPAPADGATTATFELRSGFARINVYTGSELASLVPVARSMGLDEGFGGVSFAASEGTTYAIALDTHPFEGPGAFRLRWSMGVPPPNDDFAAAAPLVGAEGSVSGTTDRATAEPDEPAHGGLSPAATVWYAWTPPGTATALVEVGSEDEESEDEEQFAVVAVYTGDDLGELVPLGTSRFRGLRFKADPGVEYKIAVETGFGVPGSFDLNWRTGTPPGNDDFADALALDGGYGQAPAARNEYATKEAGEPDHAVRGGGSLWYSWTAPVDGEATFRTAGSDFDTTLAVYQGDDLAGLELVAENDDAFEFEDDFSLTSLVSFEATAGAEFKIAVDGFAGDYGDVVLSWEEPIVGTPGADVLTGTPGRDLILALGGNDLVHGLDGKDIIFGGAGNDILDGDGGRDRVFGGGGRDRLFLRDGARDLGDGGRGRDRARVDARDRLRSVEALF